MVKSELLVAILLPLLFGASWDNADHGWIRTWGERFMDESRCIVVDDLGNSYVAGDLRPGYGAFITKLGPAGDTVWTREFECPRGNCQVHEIALDASGSIYLAGEFGGTVDFDPGPATDKYRPRLRRDSFLVKLSAFGDRQWVQTWDGYDTREPWGRLVVRVEYGLAVDSLGYVYVVGWSNSQSVERAHGYSPGEHSGFAYLRKLDMNGVLQYVHTWPGAWAADVGVDSSQSTYVTGYFAGPVDFDPAQAATIRTSSGIYDVFLSKFDASGELEWTRTWGGEGQTEADGLACDMNENVYVCGWFAGICDFDPGPGIERRASNGLADGFLAKLDTSGEFLWADTWGGTSSDACTSVALDGYGNIYATGWICGILDLSLGSGIQECLESAYARCYDLSEGLQWFYVWSREGVRSRSYDIAADYSGNIYLSGTFEGIAFFRGTENIQPVSDEHHAGVFAVKIPPDGR